MVYKLAEIVNDLLEMKKGVAGLPLMLHGDCGTAHEHDGLD